MCLLLLSCRFLNERVWAFQKQNTTRLNEIIFFLLQGCDGGDEQDAYHFWLTEGIVSGDLWKSSIGCQPYPIEISIVHTPGKSQDSPTCQRSCTNEKHKNSYGQDKVKAKEVYRLPDHDIEAAMYEIMTNGPITASYDVYDDFMMYADGVYQKTTEKKTGSHVITILGWGEYNGTPYWLCRYAIFVFVACTVVYQESFGGQGIFYFFS